MNMGSKDQLGDRTFRVNFSPDGVVKLKRRLDDKLKEFMGDYTDDTLVEYVIVLLRNGRSKAEAKSELDVFLGDDSDSFVSWVWDHLASNLDQYVEFCKPFQDDTSKPKARLTELAETNISPQLGSEKEQVEVDKTIRSRRSRKWKGHTSHDPEPPSLRSCVADEVQNERKEYHSLGGTKHSVSPNPPAQRKRSRAEPKHEIENERPKATIGAPSRLLQFAVREAVATTRQSSSLAEPRAKRLRSVVSAPGHESRQKGRSQILHSLARGPNTMAAAIKAVAEAAEDVVKTRPKRNVFDRLNRGVASPERTEDLSLFTEHAAKVGEYEDYYHHQEGIQQMDDYQPQVENHQMDCYHTLESTPQVHVERGDYSSKYIENAIMLHSDTGLASDSVSDDGGYDDINVMGHRITDVSQTVSSSGRKREDSLMEQYSVAQNAAEVSHQAQVKEQDLPISAAGASRKSLNISVNVNTWKPPHYQLQSNATELDTPRSLQQKEVDAGKSNEFMKENKSLALNGNGKADVQSLMNKTQNTAIGPGSYSTGHPLEDADSRTIFVNNVHFAATKDSLSRHFNKFGEVLKVIILTDAATGQPKGSAYVEFLRKEAAENALSLDGTSFMSRILKVMRKSSAHQEASSAMKWPRMSWGSSIAVARVSRAPFPRAYPGAYRARPPVKPGARSLQWKRDSQPTTSENVTSVTGSHSNAPPTVGRGLTYIRTATKPSGNPSAV